MTEIADAHGSPFDLTGRIALVTGSSRGIGHIVARGLLAAGSTVVLNGVDEDRLHRSADALAQEFGRPMPHRAFDVTDPDGIRDAVAWVESEVGPIDILVNNAGVQHREPLLEVSLADWHRVIETDLTSAFLVGREVARGMIRRGRGKIVNVASVQAELARPTIAAYTAAKGGLRNLTRAMTAEWAASGLQVNAIAPGYIHTEMTQSLVDDEEFNSFILSRTPARRWGRPADIVGPVVWLASAASDFVNGQTVFVDGGITTVV